MTSIRREVVSIVQFLLAGHETTTSTIASGLCQLLLRADDRALFVNERASRPAAVEEMLRFESPLQFIERRVARRTALGGQELEQDVMLKVLLGSANHDEREFADPESLPDHAQAATRIWRSATTSTSAWARHSRASRSRSRSRRCSGAIRRRD